MKSRHAVRPPIPSMLAAALALTCGVSHAQTSAEVELARRVDRLALELIEVKAQLNRLQQQRSAAAAAPTLANPSAAATRTETATTTPETTATTAAPAAPATTMSANGPSAPMAASASAQAEPATVFSSYGEINYTRPTRNSENTQLDLTRFVLGLQHRLDPSTKVVAELEVEHAVSSSGDPGEVALEQAYVERQLDRTWAARGGLFLMPAGLLNENHEPTAYYGVHRNFVETAIIPTTWREGGIQFIGNFDNGLTVQAGISTGFDLTKWDATSTEGAESPLGSIHQELALAKARDLALFGALNWRGVPGLLVGGSIFSGGATHGQAVASSRIALWDLHARWTPGRWDLSTLYSRGTISNTRALNLPLVGDPTLIPKSFDGWYAQAAYRLWTRGDYTLSPFVRYEGFNTGRAYADLGPGLTASARPTEKVVTVGANFAVGPGVVLKVDVQRFREDSSLNRFNLGLGWSF